MNGASDDAPPKVSFKDILAKKHDGKELSAEEISSIVEGACQGTMEPVQIGASLTHLDIDILGR